MPVKWIKAEADAGGIPHIRADKIYLFNPDKVETPIKIEPAIHLVSSLARFLGVGHTTIYEWLYSEQLPPVGKIINKRRYWTAAQIEDFLNRGIHESHR